jgi:methylated-DNA-protein-cysteine methyltransferase-like protein
MRAVGEFERRVREVITALVPGEVATYGEVAEEAGHPGAARAVGNVLARGEGLPWWRVVTAGGRLVRGHEAEQAGRLRAEGIPVVRGRVVPKPRPVLAVLSSGVAIPRSLGDPHGSGAGEPRER